MSTLSPGALSMLLQLGFVAYVLTWLFILRKQFDAPGLRQWPYRIVLVLLVGLTIGFSLTAFIERQL